MISFFDKPQISQAARELKPLIFEESCQVLSSFELNKIASLTFGDIVCDEIFELSEQVVSRPLDHTPLTIQKTLVMIKHILIYGSEKCVNSAYGIGAFIDKLREFNTILWAQQQQGVSAMWQRLQGGGVDRGGPVREAATEVVKLLANIDELRRIRQESASKDSLVPIGDDKVAFVTDEVRHYILKKRIEEQQRLQLKSNLKKSEGGFGGGYNAKDGKNVVGAAHGIEEMIKMANMEKKKWSDDGSARDSHQSKEEMKILQELKAQADLERAEAKRKEQDAAAARNSSLLDGSNPLFGGGGLAGEKAPAPSGDVDLLDFGGGASQPTAITTTTIDLFTASPAAQRGTSSAASSDLLGLAVAPTTAPSTDIFGISSTPAQATGSNFTPVVDPFSPSALTTSLAPSQPLQQSATVPPAGDPTGLGGQMTSLTLGNGANTTATKSIMGSNEDRFSALDALSVPTTSSVTALDRKNAENRILGFTGDSLSSRPLPAAAVATSAAPPASDGGALVPHYGTSNSNYYGGIATQQPHHQMGGGVASSRGMPPAAPPAPQPSTGIGGAASAIPIGGMIRHQPPTTDSTSFGGVPSSTLSMGMPPQQPLPSMPPPTNISSDGLMSIPPVGMSAPPAPESAMSMPAVGMGAPPVPEPVVVDPGSVRVGQTYGDNNDGDDDNPWVMGGASGSGLDPLAPAPGAPPPPPPP